ncbi:hypothetical protein [Empedobacter tilapiae]
MKLISMTDFVLEQEKLNQKNTSRLACLCANYAQFLKQPLTLAMFVPCDLEGNILEEPKINNILKVFPYERFNNACQMDKYQQAKERVLFKGFYKEFNAVISPSGGYLDIGNLRYKTIETIVESKLELTETAIKQIGL